MFAEDDRFHVDVLNGSVQETCNIPLMEYYTIFRVPEYSENFMGCPVSVRAFRSWQL